MKYFISGHGDITDEEFQTYYIAQIDKALKDKDRLFILGDFKGVDKKSLEYLKNKTKTNEVIICHIFENPRHDTYEYTKIGGFTSDNERDSFMTENSDVDIAWVRQGKEKSGTAKNLKRRKNEITSAKK